jgi:hypothetical protein
MLHMNVGEEKQKLTGKGNEGKNVEQTKRN